MKKLNAFLVSALATAALNAAVIEQVIVRQQWPWSTDVKIEYKLSGVTLPVDISVRAYNGDVELDQEKVLSALTGDRYGIAEDGVGTLVLDPVKAFGTEKVALANFKVKLSVSDSAENINDVLYKIVALEPPYAITNVTRKALLNGKFGACVSRYEDIDPEFHTDLQDVLIWTDVTNDIYKTDFIVFRRISAAGKHFMMGTNNVDVAGGAGVDVSFANDFYIGVFELTQRQVERFSHRVSYETNSLYAATRPADQMYFTKTLRGEHKFDWPEEGCVIHTGFDSKTLLSDLQNATGLLIDLPTDAMWEYACRAGTTTVLYTGNPNHVASWSDANCKKIMRAKGINGPDTANYPDSNCDLTEGPLAVGSLLPNAYGLYDMLGNIREWCLDKWCEDGSLPGGEDPVGLTLAQGAKDSSTGVMRGGCYRENAYTCYTRGGSNRGWNTKEFGARLCIYLTNGE